MKTLDKWKFRIFGADPDSVAAYRRVLPHNINVQLKRDGGYIIAKIDRVDGKDIDKSLLITEAKDIDSLVGSVNDLLYTYVKMPMNIRPYYGNVFKPEGYGDLKSKKQAKELVFVQD